MAEPMIRDVLALVGALTLGYWTWRLWAFALRWWEAFFARQAAEQREAKQAQERRAELEREEWRVIARAIGRYDASHARFSTVDDFAPRVVEVDQ